MMISGILSAFMNNVAVAALMMPVVMDIARKTNHSPSKLLMPLAYGSLLGGLTTMIGTPPNILVSEALRENGLTPFKLFDYTPVGLAVMISGVAFVTLIGVRMLPKRSVAEETTASRDFRDQYELQERLFEIKVPPSSAIVGKSLAQSRLGSALSLNVVGITRNDQTFLAPTAKEVIQADDVLIVEGRSDWIEELNHWAQLVTETGPVGIASLLAHDMQLAEVQIDPSSSLVHQSLASTGFRNRYGLNVLAIDRQESLLTEDLGTEPLHAGDVLIVHGPRAKIASLGDDKNFLAPQEIQPDLSESHYHTIDRQLRQLQVPETSKLVSKTLSESRLGDAMDIQILSITRQDGAALVPASDDRFQPGDSLIVSGAADMITVLLLQGLEGVVIDAANRHLELSVLEDDQVGLVEVMLSPHSVIAGQTLRQINFREKYGLSVLAIWRKGRAYRSGLRDMALQFGDAMLLYGPWPKLNLLGREPDFLVLTETAQERPREEKAKLAVTIMGAVMLPVILGWVPIYIAVVIGAAFMVLSKCLTMEEAYRYIEWKAVFLIAGMLPLGAALDQSGAARLLAEGVVGFLGPLGPYAVLLGLLVVTFAATSIIPTAALVVLMVPIALTTSAALEISPYALMMGIALAASSSFTSPISHPANVLVMGPGGYRFVDYVKVGLPLTLVVLVVLMVVLPLFYPLTP
jgi:di/tricarboxylate transporter